MSLTVLYTAAHAEWPETEPLGGGQAVADWLTRRWRETQPFALRVLSPTALGLRPERPLTQLSEREYARFCRQFERAATAAVLEHDPAQSVVLSNDVSEGPDFAILGRRGYRVVTIFHVDVVEYFTRFYLGGVVPPHWLTRLASYRWLPELLQLVFQKQLDAVRHSAQLVVPSPPMRAVIRRCYPWCPAERIAVLPWGNIAPAPSAGTGTNGDPVANPAEFVILTLSRLSPEKGLERLLAALRVVEADGWFSTRPERKVRLVVCGAPAYMRGQRYAARLRALAGRLQRIPVEFQGHVTGARKTAWLRRADLFVSPSRHESYGLTIAEALGAGARVLSHPHYGARGRLVDCGDVEALARALREEIAAGRAERAPQTEAVRQGDGGDAASELARMVQAIGRRGGCD